jgi:hydroxymethylbilane synthase
VIRVGTRRSALALVQANEVADALRAAGAAVEIAPMRTEGDRLDGASLALVGGKGLFVREIEEALLASRIDVAVHSLKDLPAELPPGLCLAALPPRADPRDVLVTRGGGRLRDLAPGAVVGTSSPRRRALVLAARPDLRVEPLRGNVDTRLRKLESAACDAVILAAAGLHRLGVMPAHAEMLDPEDFIPAVGQGIIAVEARVADGPTLAALAALDHCITRACAEAERAFLERLGASCNSPLAAHATVVAAGEHLRLTALVASDDGGAVLRARGEGSVARAAAIGRDLADTLLERGAAEVAPLRPVAGGTR